MYNRKDSYYLKAKQEGYKSRAAYKLLELNQKYKLISKNYCVLDCGAAPGGWSQVALKLVGAKGCVVAVDYAEITGINANNFTFIKGNINDEKTVNALMTCCDGYDIVLSDMAPKTTGIKIKDHIDSLELVKTAFSLAERTLKPNGTFLAKLFDGEEREHYIKSLKKVFNSVKIIRPDSTRKSSYEIYIIASGYTKLDI